MKRLLRDFGASELEPEARATITKRLAVVGLKADPPLETATEEAIVTLHVDPSGPAGPDETPAAATSPPPAATAPSPPPEAGGEKATPANESDGEPEADQGAPGNVPAEPAAKEAEQPPQPPKAAKPEKPKPAAAAKPEQKPEPPAAAKPEQEPESAAGASPGQEPKPPAAAATEAAMPAQAPDASEQHGEGGLDAAVGGAERASRTLQARARSVAARLERLERELAAERAVKEQALSEARELRAASEKALRSTPSTADAIAPYNQDESADEPEEDGLDVDEPVDGPDVDEPEEAQAEDGPADDLEEDEPEDLGEDEAEDGPDEEEDEEDEEDEFEDEEDEEVATRPEPEPRGRRDVTREAPESAAETDDANGDEPAAATEVGEPDTPENMRALEADLAPSGKKRKFRLGLRRRQRSANAATCAVCKREPNADERPDLAAAGWSEAADKYLCTECVGEGWRLTNNSGRPYRALKGRRAD